MVMMTMMQDGSESKRHRSKQMRPLLVLFRGVTACDFSFDVIIITIIICESEREGDGVRLWAYLCVREVRTEKITAEFFPPALYEEQVSSTVFSAVHYQRSTLG